MSVSENLQALRASLKPGVRLVAVSKTMPVSVLREAYDAGQRHFGENKVQEITLKQPEMPQDVLWHFIGHLQTNKVKYIAPFVHLIESVDSLKLLKEIDKQGARNQRVINCLLQFYIADEETKFGLDRSEAQSLMEAMQSEKLNHVAILGVMGMASFTDDQAQIRNEFKQLKGHFDWLKNEWFATDERFCEISMGMSGDYQIAMEEGSTNVRIGTGIFGVRVYNK
ncbi:MAG: YggS family pyridoxal phosphate-dependent enzyme [Bacteroidales bacterium]|nr:YggS family pyridoxal phosphate-dependent enzyme [Bacteroidales bacterium]